jgi:hypothetical protein
MIVETSSPAASAMQRRDGKPSRFMTSVLAFALAVSTLIAPSALARGEHDCCKRASAPSHSALQCCMPDRPEQTPRQAPPQAPTTPAPELLPLLPVAASVPPLLVPMALAIACPGRMVATAPLYLLHATLLV